MDSPSPGYFSWYLPLFSFWWFIFHCLFIYFIFHSGYLSDSTTLEHNVAADIFLFARERRAELLAKWRAKGGVFLIGYSAFRNLSLGKNVKDRHMAREICYALQVIVVDLKMLLNNIPSEFELIVIWIDLGFKLSMLNLTCKFPHF